MTKQEQINKIAGELLAYQPLIDIPFEQFYKVARAIVNLGYRKKDFSEKLKERCHNYYPSIDHYCCSVKAVSVKDINDLLKEYDK